MPHLVKITLRTLVLSFYVGVRVVLGLWAAVIAARRLLQEVKTEQHHVPLFLTTWTTAVVVWSRYNPNGGRVTANVSQHVCLSPCFMCSKKKSQSKEWSLVKVQGQTHHFKPPWKKRILPVSEISQISQNQISFLNLNHIQTPTVSLVHTLEQQTVNKIVNKNIM